MVLFEPREIPPLALTLILVVPFCLTRKALSPAGVMISRESLGTVLLIPMRDPVEVTSPPETSIMDAEFRVRSDALTWLAPCTNRN